MTRLLLIDNYDSYTYNLVQLLGELGAEVEVRRNDAIEVAAIGGLGVDAIVLSPGPSSPDNAGITLDVVRSYAGRLPLLGVCLGHQAIGQAFGGRVVRNHRIVHGKTSEIHHDGQGIFAGIPSPFPATRYHSLVLERASLPGVLEVTAWTDEDEIMGVRHRELDVVGVQFHPESILTTCGRDLLGNWLEGVAAATRAVAGRETC